MRSVSATTDASVKRRCRANVHSVRKYEKWPLYSKPGSRPTRLGCMARHTAIPVPPGEWSVGDDRSMRTYPALRISPPDSSPDFADLIAAALDDFGILAIQETEDGAVVAYLSDGRVRSAAAEAVLHLLPGARIESLDVPDEDWARRSQEGLRAIRAGALTVAPPWDAPHGVNDGTIVILPSTGFGTGHHATTRLCLEALQKSSISGATVLDVGTGSGVLAIAAARLGARRVVAIDDDIDAVDNARENVALNGVDVDLRVAGIEAVETEGAAMFDIVIANLTGATLVRFARALQTFTAVPGTLILSGMLDDEADSVIAAYSLCEAQDKVTEDEWVCLVLRRTQA